MLCKETRWKEQREEAQKTEELGERELNAAIRNKEKAVEDEENIIIL